MARPSYTIYSNHPRVYFRDTDIATLRTRTTTTSKWETFWQGSVLPRAETLKDMPASSLVDLRRADNRIFLLGLVGLIEEDSMYLEAAINATLQVAESEDSVRPDKIRYRLLALAHGFDLCYDSLTASQKDKIAAEMLQQMARVGTSDMKIAGTTGNDLMCVAAGALAIAEYGSYDWQTPFNRALDYWYGSAEQNGRYHMWEHAASDGGSERGAKYCILGNWGVFWLAKFLRNATTDVDPFTEFSTAYSKFWEWIIWTQNRGGSDDDHESEGDTARITTPLFSFEQRQVLGILSQEFPTPLSTDGGRHVRWLIDELEGHETTYSEDGVYDVVNYDRGTNTAVAPASGTPVPATSRMFSPPGVYRYRSSWDPDDYLTIRINGHSHYWLNHLHLNSGSVMIRYRDDPLLLSPAGVFDSYGGTHHENCYQRTWMQSLAPLIMDPAQTYQRWNDTVLNDGGQHYKKYAGSLGSTSTPETVPQMTNLMNWSRTGKFDKIRDDSLAVFLSMDLRKAYRQDNSTGTDRASVIESKYLIVKPNVDNGLTHEVLLFYCRIVKTIDASSKVYIPLHARGDWAVSSTGASVTGIRTEDATGSPGKLWVEILDKSDYAMNEQLYASGTPDSDGYTDDQFRHPDSAATGQWKPSKAFSTRHQATLKRSSLYVELTTHAEQEDYVMLLMPTAAAASKPSYTFVEDSNFYGFTAGTETYKIHKTSDLAIVGSGESADTTAPAEATSLTLFGEPSSIRATWTDPADADLDKINVWYRTT